MNRYPVWKYAIIVIALLLGVIYTLPNFFGEAPAVQVSSGKATVKVDTSTLQKVEDALQSAGVKAQVVSLEGASIRARFESTDTQLKAKDAIQKALIADPADPQYVVALNLVSRSPVWLSNLHAAPMYLGLDLRGGVHFMLQVDMKAALTQRVEALAGDLRAVLREKDIRHGGIVRNGQGLEIRLRDAQQLALTKSVLGNPLGVRDALFEDIGRCDWTAQLVPAGRAVKAHVRVREDAVLCGRDWFEGVFRALDPASLAALLQRYFTQRLMQQRQASQHTIASMS